MKLFLSYIKTEDNSINLLKSSCHELVHNVFNYSGKEVNIDGANVYDYKDIEKHRENVRNRAIDSDCDVLVPIDPNTKFYDSAIDSLITNHLTDNNYGSSYSDFYIRSKDGILMHVLHRSLPSVINMYPFISFTIKALRQYKNSDNVEGDILSKLASKHIPEPLGEFLE